MKSLIVTASLFLSTTSFAAPLFTYVQDRMPVDGPKLIIDVSRHKDSDRFALNASSAHYDRIAGKYVTEDFQIGNAMACTIAHANDVVCVMDESRFGGTITTFTVKLNAEGRALELSKKEETFANGIWNTDLEVLGDDFTLEPVEKKPIFTCSYGPVGRSKYTHTLDIYENELHVLRSSMIAEYAPVAFNILANDDAVVPDTKPLYTCKTSNRTADRYKLEIEVFEKVAIVSQSSTVGRYKVLKYDLTAK